MTPYYEQDGITIYHGDVLELPPMRCDLLLTDPPYSRAGGLHTGRQSSKEMHVDAANADQFWLHWFRDAAKAMCASVVTSGCGFSFCDYRTIALVERAVSESATGWHVSQCLVWDRDSVGMGSPFRASYELIAFMRGPNFQWTGRKDIRNVLRYRWPYGGREHGAEKPVELLAILIRETTQPNAVVLDPFAGSGSTLVAAAKTGRRAVGVEISERFCEIAARRLREEGHSDLFGEATA